MKEHIYLDHSATSPVHPKVLEKMVPYFQDKFGNPSSIHAFGKKAKVALEDARISLADALHGEPPRIVFTSGGTESDFLALVGVALANQEKGKHIITTKIEHTAIMEAANFLQGFGFEVTFLSVDSSGQIDLNELQSSIREDTILISIMYVNNEIGTIMPVEEIGKIAHEHGIFFHSDAVQAFPILDIEINKLPIDLLTVSSHKINGPKGIGALYIKNEVPFHPVFGGSQERKRRGGTENVPGIIGFGEAAKILRETKMEKYDKYLTFRNKMINIWNDKIGENNFVVNGSAHVVPSILNVSFLGIDSQSMIMSLDMKGIAVSGGSACSSGILSVSRTIKELHLTNEVSNGAFRISFGYGNTEEQVEKAANEIAKIVLSKRK